MCRIAAVEVSALKPQLDAHNVRFIGVGLEELGVEEFVKEKYFDGELFIDSKKEAYNSLGYKRFGVFSTFWNVFSSKGRALLGLAKQKGISGNFRGDGWQNGGCLVVSAGGKEVLMNFIQEGPAEHVSTEEILKALRIDEPVGGVPSQSSVAAGESESKVECNDDVCTRK